MPEYKFQREVRERAEEYVKALLASGYNARLLEHTFRDYCVKVAIEKSGLHLGEAIVYYKPSQKRHELKTHELKIRDLASDIERIWLEQESRSQPVPQEGVLAYVDGSFIDGKIGYGAVILRDGCLVQEFSGSISSELEGLTSTRQVAGEMQAAYEVLEWAANNAIAEISLHFDYEGLESWANGSWLAKNPQTAKYHAYVSNCPVRITWHKVAAHSGNHWNDRADELARQGARSRNPVGAQDPIEMLVAHSEAFVAFLALNGIESHFDRIYNEMYSRIVFSGTSGINVLDIYNTRKQHLEPKWNGFSDSALRDQVKQYRQGFIAGNDAEGSDSRQPQSRIQTVEHYLEVLRPYKHLNFDFVELAELVINLEPDKTRAAANLEEVRYNFDLIEKTFFRLKGDNHG